MVVNDFEYGCLSDTAFKVHSLGVRSNITSSSIANLTCEYLQTLLLSEAENTDDPTQSRCPWRPFWSRVA